MKMPSNLMQLRVLAFCLVLIIVPFFIGYYYWISSQTTYFNGRNLRILATLSTHIEESVAGQSSVLKNAVEKYVQEMADGNLYWPAEPGENAQRVTIQQLHKKDATQNFQTNALDPFKGDGAILQARSVKVVPTPADPPLLAVEPGELVLHVV